MTVFVFGNVAQLRPRKTMIEIIFHLVVLRQAQQVTMLHVHEIVGASTPYVHFEFWFSENKYK